LNDKVVYEERYFVNDRKQRLFTPLFRQRGDDARALVFVVPGFGDTAPTLWSDFCLRRPTVEAVLELGFAKVLFFVLYRPNLTCA
jgi:hypothetical protein